MRHRHSGWPGEAQPARKGSSSRAADCLPLSVFPHASKARADVPCLSPPQPLSPPSILRTRASRANQPLHSCERAAGIRGRGIEQSLCVCVCVWSVSVIVLAARPGRSAAVGPVPLS